MKINRGTFFIVLVLTLCVAYLGFFGLKIDYGSKYTFHFPGAADIRFGIDIRGGVDAVYEPVNYEGVPTAAELESARSIIETRLDQRNILDRDVTVDLTNGDIIVRFPWQSGEVDFDPQKAISELGETAKLTFRDSAGTVLVDGSHVTESVPVVDAENGGFAVSLRFDDEGARLFEEATTRLVGMPIEIWMDEVQISAPVVEEAIAGGQARITLSGAGNTAEEAIALASKIAAGALPFSMQARNYSTISPSLGAGALNVMVTAGIWAYVLICIGMIAYYRLPGVVGCIALLLQIGGQILALSIPGITLTLPGIAGLILSIGMGVDANVIIAERISEEIKGGRRTGPAIKLGFKNAFSSVFDGNITVMIVAIILMVLGSGAMLSFAYSLLTGVLLNFLAGVTASRLMMRSLSLYPALSREPLYESFSRRITP